MIEVLPESRYNILGVKGIGKLTDLDYKNILVPRLEGMIKDYKKIRCLFLMSEEFHGWELEAAWDDAKFGVQHRNDFEKVAVVGGPRWVEWGTKLAALIMSGEVKTFSSEQLDEAWDWVKSEGKANASSPPR